MQVGIKLWSSNPVKYVKDSDFADFIEVLPRSGKSLEKFVRRQRKYAVHVPHEVFGFCPLLDMKKSKKLLEHAIKAAKKLKTETLIMHTGYMRKLIDEKSMKEMIKSAARLVRSANYGRILIENNVPKGTFYIDADKFYACYNHEQIKEVLELSGAGFCLDFEHAAITAHQLRLNYRKHVTDLMRLKPDYFHLSGVRLASNHIKGHHLSIFEGDIDLSFVKNILKKANKPVCLETPVDIEQRKREVEFLKN